jgi:hypothetical protein
VQDLYYAMALPVHMMPYVHETMCKYGQFQTIAVKSLQQLVSFNINISSYKQQYQQSYNFKNMKFIYRKKFVSK